MSRYIPIRDSRSTKPLIRPSATFSPSGEKEQTGAVQLAYELKKRGFRVEQEKAVPVIYDEVKLECGFRADLLVNEHVVVELKATSTIHAFDKAQTLSHLRLLNLRIGLLINFHETKLVDGVHRIANGY